MAKDKSIGISNKDNLAGWADHAKNNSYQCDKAALKDKLTSDKGAADTVNEAERPLLKPFHEGRGWTEAKAHTSDTTYTGKNGSKRD